MIYPKHIALIPDGNRTWAKEKGLHQMLGHLEGLNRFVELINYVFTNTPIEVFTIWGLSTENLHNRSTEELSYLFEIYKKTTTDIETFLLENKINFRWIGSPEGLPENLVELLLSNQEKFKFDTNKYIVLAINYGGRHEILRGVNKIIEAGKQKIDSEEEFAKYLDLGDLPNVDLVIRTKGDYARRLSGFMLWRVGYAELYFSTIKFPDFNSEQMQKALERFDEISSERNFGK